MKNKTLISKVLAPLAVLGLTAFVTIVIINSKPEVAKKEAADVIRDVQAIAYSQQNASFPLASQGVVTPLTHIRYLSEVSGKIIEVSPKWADGGFFRKGELLLRVEEHTYKSQLAKAEAALEQAKTNLTQEKAQAYVAKKNWEASNRAGDDNPAARSLALREPQLATAQAQLASAEADRSVARLMLEKTQVRAQFDGIIHNKAVDIGQVVGTGQQLADFYGTAKAEIRVPLTLAQQAFLSLPGLTQQAEIPVDVFYQVANKTHHYVGQLKRTSAVLDEKTRVLHGVVEVNDPYSLQEENRPALPLGAFVEVQIRSEEQQQVVALPKRLLRPGNRIWVADTENRLQLRDVAILPSRSDEIYIRQGLLETDRIIVSSIVDARPGNLVKVTLIDNDSAEP